MPTALRASLGVLFWYVPFFVILTVYQMYFGKLESMMGFSFMWYLIMGASAFFFAGGLESFFDADKFEEFTDNITDTFVIGIVIWLATLLSSLVISSFVTVNNASIFNASASFIKDTGIIGLIITCCVAPLIDEFMFRGLVYTGFREDFGVIVGAIVSAGIFALFHFSLLQFIPMFIVGLILCFAYEKYENIFVVIGAHATWNILSIVMAMI